MIKEPRGICQLEELNRFALPNEAFAIKMLANASLSGHEETIRLAAQISNTQPCDVCGFIWIHCRCS